MQTCNTVSPDLFIVENGSNIICEINGKILKVKLCEDLSVVNLKEKLTVAVEVIQEISPQER